MTLSPRRPPWLAALALFAGFAASPALAAAPAVPPPAGKPIDLVLALDTSNSMDGLIDSAKLKLWDVVNELAKLKPTPDLRVALYSYGNDGYPAANGWVRKELDLTGDLDEVYKSLNALKTHGGTELVARVTRAALADQKWSPADGALKLVFVCGNEAVDQDKQVTLEGVAAAAKKQGVVVNTIYCGPENDGIAAGWRLFAGTAGGKYANIDQNKAKNQVAVATEFDKEIVELSGKLNTTYLGYGKEAQLKAGNQAAQDANAAAAAPGAAVARAASKAGGLYRNDTWDLCDRVKNDKTFDLKSVKVEDLPDELRKLTPDERVAAVKKKTEEREALQKKVAELTAKRAKKVEEELAKLPKTDGEKALDDALRGTLREQAKAKGFEVPGK